MLNEDNDPEYRLPMKLLTSRDPIIAGALSIREFLQWCFFLGIIYVVFNTLSIDSIYKVMISSFVVMFAFAFIHTPTNGLAGIEWGYIWLRFRLEKQRHFTVPPLSVTEAATGYEQPSFKVSLRGFEEENEPQRDGNSLREMETESESESEVEVVQIRESYQETGNKKL